MQGVPSCRSPGLRDQMPRLARLRAVRRASRRATSLTNFDSASLEIMRHESQNYAPARWPAKAWSLTNSGYPTVTFWPAPSSVQVGACNQQRSGAHLRRCPIIRTYRTSPSPDTWGGLTPKKRAKAPRRAMLRHDSVAKPRTWNIPGGTGFTPVSGLGPPRHPARRAPGRRPFGRSGFYRRRCARCPE
jgi:hypothetical protein